MGDPDTDESPSGGAGSFFVWTVVLLLLVAFAIACWIGSFYIFGHPEKPLSYAILTRLDKLEPPKRFELTGAPRGEFLRPKQLFERYSRMSPRELERTNENLLRNYLRNFRLTRELVPYVVGTYNIIDSFELGASDFFPTGVVAVAQAKDNPNVLLEQIFTAPADVVPALHKTLLTGLDLDLKRENEISAVIHVEKLPDGKIKVTAVSILYPSYESATASGTFSLQPPERLNVAAGLPVVNDQRLREAEAAYAGYRQRAGLPATAATGNATVDAAANRLMRVERPVAVNIPSRVERAVPVNPTPPALPDDAPVLPAIPVDSTAPVAAATPAEATPTPATASPTPADVADATPPASPLATPAPEAPSPTPATIAATGSGAWPVYAPGQMPRGRLLNVRDMAEGGAPDVASERAYLQGNFVVTASGADRAVLRNQGPITEALGLGGSGRASTVRIIVEYPSGSRPPAEGATFSRDERRPFQIMQVRPAGDGQLNVYVREVTRP